jgi:hypothetical protein
MSARMHFGHASPEIRLWVPLLHESALGFSVDRYSAAVVGELALLRYGMHIDGNGAIVAKRAC